MPVGLCTLAEQLAFAIGGMRSANALAM